MVANPQNLAKVHYSRAGRILFTVLAGLLGEGTVPAAPPAKAKVIRVHDGQATRNLTPHAARVQGMLEQGLVRFTGQPTTRAAWARLVTPKDVIGLKVDAQHGPLAGTRPAVAEAVARSLVKAGIPAGQIVIWDRSLAELQQAGFGRVAKALELKLAGAREAGYESHPHLDVALEPVLQPGDRFYRQMPTAEQRRRSHLTQLLTRELTCVINLHPLISHPVTGTRGHLEALGLDSVDNTHRLQTSPHHLRLSAPNLYQLAAYSHALPPARVTVGLKAPDSGRSLLLQPASMDAYFYFRQSGQQALPLKQALQDALRAATAKGNAEAQPLLVHDREFGWRQYLLPHGGTVLGAGQLRTDRPLPASRVRLCITDALVCQFHLADTRRADYATTLNELWLGTDPVALDLMAAARLVQLREFVKLPTRTEAKAMRKAAGQMGLGVTRLEDVTVIDLPARPK